MKRISKRDANEIANDISDCIILKKIKINMKNDRKIMAIPMFLPIEFNQLLTNDVIFLIDKEEMIFNKDITFKFFVGTSVIGYFQCVGVKKFTFSSIDSTIVEGLTGRDYDEFVAFLIRKNVISKSGNEIISLTKYRRIASV